MTGEMALYFSAAEFMVMLETAGGGRCSLLSSGKDPDDEALRQAFVSLFQRGMLERRGDGLALSRKGEMFEQIRNAPYAVVISWQKPHPGRAVCYIAEEAFWLVELADMIVAEQYRVRCPDRRELAGWFLENDLLEQPFLTETDTAELSVLFADELEEPSGRVLLQLEKHRNGGRLLASYEVVKCRGEQLIRSCGPDGCTAAIYTKEALSQMLADCFGKGSYL